MKNVYYILSFIIDVVYVYYLYGYHLKLGPQIDEPKIAQVLGIILFINTIIALFLYIFSTPKKNIDETVW